MADSHRSRCWGPARRMQGALFVLLACLAAAVTPAASTSFVTYGPGIVNPAGYHVLLNYYNASYVPYNPNAPAVIVGLSLSLGTDPAFNGLDQALQAVVELINFRGGVLVGGVQHYLSVTYAVDGGSSAMAQSIYAAMQSWGNISAYIAPSSDALLQSVTAQLQSSPALTLAVQNVDPADYSSASPYLFSLLNTATSTWTSTLSAINAQAQAYAAGGGSGSANGIKTLCMLSTNDSLTQAAAAGVRQWIVAENARRGNADNITVYVDVVWSRNSSTMYKDYLPALARCPAAVDVMVLQNDDLASLDIALALTASQLRPRAVLGINPGNTLLAQTPTAAVGWTVALSTSLAGSASSLGPVGGKLSSYIDVSTGAYYWSAGAGATGTLPGAAFLYAGALDVLLAAFNQSTSLAASNLRSGLLSLNGRSSICGPLSFSATTGVNNAAQFRTAQVQSSGNSSVVNLSSPLAYPWLWPPAPVQSSLINYITHGPGVASPSGVQSLMTGCNASYVARNDSWPSVSIGLSLSVGANSLLAGFDGVMQYIVDLVNFRGGITISGVQHYLSITYAKDDGSTELTQYIYEDMIQSGQHTLYLAPSGDNLLKSLSSLLQSTQAVVVSPSNADPTDYLTPNTNLISLLDTADSRWIETLTLINSHAADYARTSGTGSTNGIKTLCMLSTNDTIVQAAANGVRRWIVAENARRGNADNITVHVDGLWATNVTGAYLDYVPYLNACPDDVDVMLLQDGSATLNAQQALIASGLRPKSALGLDPSGLSLYSAPPVAVSGWLLAPQVILGLESTLPALGGKWFEVHEAGGCQDVWAAGSNVSVAAAQLSYPYMTAVDLIAAALARTASSSPADIRAALQSLNGQSTLLGPLQLDNTTGVNSATAATLVQFKGNGVVTFVANQSHTPPGAQPLTYPFDWPWPARIRVGDALVHSQNSGLAILGVVICVLGAWVAQIMVEQSIFVRRKGGWYQLWLLVVSMALGGVGVWCAVLMFASALIVSKPNGGGPLDVVYAFEVALLAWLPAMLLTWCGLMVLMGDVESANVNSASRASQAQQVRREQKEAKKKKAALSNRAHFFHLVQSITWRSVLGGLLVAIAIATTRALMWYLWVQDASLNSAGWAWAVTALFNIVGVPLALMMFFHALRWRIAAVFLFAVCVILDYQVQLAGMTFYYAPGHQSLPATLLTADIDATIVNLIAGIIAAFSCFIFIGLQFSRMQLSRNGLSVLVASLEALINRQKEQLRVEADTNQQLRSQLTAALRLIEHINIVTPIPTEYAFAMASSTQLETFQALYAAAGDGSPGARRGSAVRTAHASMIGNGSSSRSIVSAASGGGPNAVAERSTVGAGRMSTTSKRDASKQMTAEDVAELRELSFGPKRGSDGAEPDALNRPEPVATQPSETAQADSVQRARIAIRANYSKVAPSPSTSNLAVNAAADGTVDDGSLLSPAINSAVAAAVATSPLSAASGEAGPANIAGPFNVRRSSATTSSARASVLHAPNAPNTLIDQPAEKSRLGSTTRPAQQAYRTSEDELAASLEAQVAFKEGLALAASKNGGSISVGAAKGRKISAMGGGAAGSPEDHCFDLTMPLLGQASLHPSAVTPTLKTLLCHPVCVEVVKAELQNIHSVENLVFYLHAARYRHVQSAKLRKVLASAITEHFIRENAPQQININTRQRDAITATVARRGDECSVELFKEAEREVLQLMETNVMKALSGTAAMRLCSWVLVCLPMAAVTSSERPTTDGDRNREDRVESTMVLSDVESSVAGA